MHQDPSSLASAGKKLILMADFQRYGERYGIDYHFPRQGGEITRALPVLHGDVEEMRLGSGISLTRSDVQVLEAYETFSCHDSPLYMLVVLEGQVQVSHDNRQFPVRTGMVFVTRLTTTLPMRVSHIPGQRLRTLSLGVCPGEAWHSSSLASLLRDGPLSQPSARIWSVPDSLQSGLSHLPLNCVTGRAKELILEGMIMQLLGYGLSQQPGLLPAAEKVLHCEHQRLATIRQLIEQSPEKEYTLSGLARQAAMSPSSLRSKFRLAYGCTLFDFVRDCRLSLAHRYLLAGHSVQQAAWQAGYQHATNFSTAFRRRYGISPVELRRIRS